MIRLRAPAKLNLYLRVLGRRPDGYHQLETVFERLDLADELTFETHPSAVSLSCTDPAPSCGEDNLVLKAARLLQQVSGTAQGARIHLIKRIPIAAGLGGGSSDAATTLLGLNELWKLQLECPTLLQLAATLGSDVPFFLSQTPFAIGRGRGEVCEPIAQTPRLTQVLVVPDKQLSTQEIYEGAQFDPSTDTQRVRPGSALSPERRRRAQGRILSAVEGFDLTAPKPSITMVVHALSNGSLGELAKGLWNDLEPEAIRRCPVIAIIQAHLRNLGCLGTCLSGSGPSVFGLCGDVAHAQDVAARLDALSAVPGAAEAGVAAERRAERRKHSARSWRIEIVQTDHPSPHPGNPACQGGGEWGQESSRSEKQMEPPPSGWGDPSRGGLQQ
jgi:4-diphosphocytidyl-2-C-methyl-D-erythritol kinase